MVDCCSNNSPRSNCHQLVAAVPRAACCTEPLQSPWRSAARAMVARFARTVHSLRTPARGRPLITRDLKSFINWAKCHRAFDRVWQSSLWGHRKPFVLGANVGSVSGRWNFGQHVDINPDLFANIFANTMGIFWNPRGLTIRNFGQLRMFLSDKWSKY